MLPCYKTREPYRRYLYAERVKRSAQSKQSSDALSLPTCAFTSTATTNNVKDFVHENEVGEFVVKLVLLRVNATVCYAVPIVKTALKWSWRLLRSRQWVIEWDKILPFLLYGSVGKCSAT